MKSTKKALFTSALSLLLCVSMLIGTTFAWFTDSVTSGVNQIVAGNLDIEVTHSNAHVTDKSISGEAAMFTDADGKAMLWEPGAMAYESFKVANVGSLALKYNMSMNVVAYNKVTATGDNLMDALKVKVLTGTDILTDPTREDVAALNWTGSDVKTLDQFKKNGGKLYPVGTDGQSSEENFQVVVYWEPTDNDNRWNLQNGKASDDGQPLHINFGVNVVATQLEYESDSFDNLYDESAENQLPAIGTAMSVSKTKTDIGEGDAFLNTELASITIPSSALPEEDDYTLRLDVERIENLSDDSENVVTVDIAGNTLVTYDVSLWKVVDDTQTKMESSSKVYIVSLFIGKYNDLIKFYHKGVAITDFSYDPNTGYVTYMTDSFSPYAAEYMFAGGMGTESHPYMIANREQMESISCVENFSYFEWCGDSEVDASHWSHDIYLCGSFDGNGVVFNDLDGSLFRSIWNGSDSWAPSEDITNTYKVENLTANLNVVGDGWISGIVRTDGVHDLVMENVSVHGYIEGATGVSPFVCFGPGNYDPSYTYDGNITFRNCHSDATVVAKSGNAVGFVAHAMMKSAAGKITLENSDFDGTMSATAPANCKYAVGNWCNATITDDQSAAKNNVIYKANVNGWQYIAAGKYGSFAVEQQERPENVGETFTVPAKTGATKATFALQIAPNPGNMVSTYLTEEIELTDNSFTSNMVKYFQIKVNADGATETGVDGNVFNVVYSDYNGTLGSNTLVRVTQYNASGAILGVTEINFHDVK